MKIRNGFVSNSSATSFIVLYKPGKHDGSVHPSRLATDDDVKKLIGFGFRKTCTSRPDLGRPIQYCDECEDRKKYCMVETPFGVNLYYDVSCNEDEPIKFLIDNDIPFIASLPYGCGIAVYMRGKKSVLVMDNDGENFMMGHNGNTSESDSYIHPKYPWDKKPKTARYIPKDKAVNL
jgi:hypothetical protein